MLQNLYPWRLGFRFGRDRKNLAELGEEVAQQSRN